MVNSGLAKKINIFCLLAAIIAVLLLPLKKEIWYDETVSMLCSKGISSDAPSLFANTNTTNSDTLGRLNTAGNVFSATVLDNGNSFLFNIGLHWFTLMFGNDIATYLLFSKLCGIAALIAFYFLCNLFFEGSLFTSVAIILLTSDLTFMAMSHEIRAYAMGIFFITLAGIYFYKFMYRSEKPIYLFLLGLFSVGAVLSHFLAVYIVLVFVGGLVLQKKWSLFSLKNVLALAIPVCLVAVFFYFSHYGLVLMNKQNQAIQQRTMAEGFNLWQVLLRSMKYTAINFKTVYPSLINKSIVIAGSFLIVVVTYVAGIRVANTAAEKRNLHLLFLSGISSSFFLAFLSIKSHHYTSLYFRYYSFCLPFATLFTAYFLFVIFNSKKMSKVVNRIIMLIVLVPAVALSLVFNFKANPKVKYNHTLVARQIIKNNVRKIDVPEWKDAFLFQSILPEGYKIDYVVNPTSLYFTLYSTGAEEKVLVIRDES
jgi:hypothetical protein